MSFFSTAPNGYPTYPARSSPFAGPSAPASGSSSSLSGDPQFDIFEWYPAYQSCQRYFLDHAQHEATVQTVAALVNISLPCQWRDHPVLSSAGQTPASGAYGSHWQQQQQQQSRAGVSPNRPAHSMSVSLLPFIRRLVVTGFDKEGVLHGFFGDDWRKGIGPVQECERRNYLFAAKSASWAKVKQQYDMSPHETVPFLRPLQNVQLAEIEGAEKTWSQWLMMQDWMLGPRAPTAMDDIKENDDA